MSDFLYFVFPGLPVSKEKQIAREIIAELKGGEGSGNFGHAGRPGEVGGSAGEGKNNNTINRGGGNIGNYLGRNENEKTIVDKIIFGASSEGDLVSGDRLSDFGIKGELIVYRGAPDYAENKLRNGDFVLLDSDMARSYSPKGKLITQKVSTRDLTFYQRNGYQIEMKYEPIN